MISRLPWTATAPGTPTVPVNAASPPPALPLADSVKVVEDRTLFSAALLPPVASTLSACMDPVRETSRAAVIESFCVADCVPGPFTSRPALTVMSSWPTSVPFRAASRPAPSLTAPTALVLAPRDRSSPVATSSLPPLLIPPVALRLPWRASSERSPTDSIAPSTPILRWASTAMIEPPANFPPTAVSRAAVNWTSPVAAAVPLTRMSPAPLLPSAWTLSVEADSTLLTAALLPAETSTTWPWISPPCAMSRPAANAARWPNATVPVPPRSRPANRLPFACPCSSPVTTRSRPLANVASPPAVVVPERLISVPA